MNAPTKATWADRLGPTARTISIIIATLLAIFAIGMIGGFSYGVIEDGALPARPVAYLIFAAMVGLLIGLGWVLLQLFQSLHPERMSGFDRRYWKMWGIVLGLSFVLGIGAAIFGISDQSDGFSLILSNEPIAPVTAILASLVGAILLIASVIVYFRTIDDHEAQAYLWGSNVAFHFLALAFPLAWLLARGGLVPPLTIGIALLIVLASCLVQAIVWALFKFR
jgi:hypothetical protein